jgi:poly(3-hydroxybutyrate) depolymerase
MQPILRSQTKFLLARLQFTALQLTALQLMALQLTAACTPDVDVPASETAPGTATSTTSTAAATPAPTTSATPAAIPSNSAPGTTSTSAAAPTTSQSSTSSLTEGNTDAASSEPPTTFTSGDSPDVDSSERSNTKPIGTSEDAPSSDDSSALPALQAPAEPISFGTTLDAAEVMTASRELAQAQTDPTSATWRAKGDQHRTYHFADTNKDEPYRLYVPTDWDGTAKLPLVMFLHGSGSNENNYVDQNDKQMIGLAQASGTILVAPLGAAGAYGNFLRLSAPFGNQQAADELVAQITPESRRSNELSEMDVINVLELVLAEYPVDHSSLYLTGHSMGSGGTWYIGGKYSTYWRAIAPMSGPFVQETGYPWNNLKGVGILVTEGTQTPSLDGSRLLGTWLSEQGFDAEYKEVNADHGGMVPLVLPDVFEFFASKRER